MSATIFKISGMDCAEEIAALKREIGRKRPVKYIPGEA